ncbi:MAG: QsdR family transcriptional regulator [Solirubrobacterales bacterium]
MSLWRAHLDELIQCLIDAEIEQGDYRSPADTTTLAYVLVRLAEALLFNYEADAVPKDAESLREVIAALLSAPAVPPSAS